MTVPAADPSVRTKRYGRIHSLATFLVKTILVMFVLWCFFFWLDARSEFNRLPLFNAVKLGMRGPDAWDVLFRAGVWCDLTAAGLGIDSPAPVSTACRFSDYKHDYLIVVDPNTNVVVKKSMRTGRIGRRARF